MKVKELVTYPYFVCREDIQDDKYIYYGFSFKEDADEFIMLDDARMNYSYQKPRYIYYYVDGDSEVM